MKAVESRSVCLMTARIVLCCEPESFRFERRVLNLNTAIRVGRACSRNQSSRINANFDCKVLSRNHALLSYEDGRFFIQDTKSSNGTFVNGMRLSSNRSESLPYELSSGDLLQFGVPIVETNSKQPHVSIITKIQLYDHNGHERKFQRLERVNLSFDQVFTLSSYLRKAFDVESSLEKRITQVRHVLQQNIVLTSQKWHLILKNEELLSSIKNLECRLRFYARHFPSCSEQVDVVMIKEEKRLMLETSKKALKLSYDENIKLKATLSALENSYDFTQLHLNVLSRQQNEMDIHFQKILGQVENSQKTIESITNEMEEVKCSLNQYQVNYQNVINSIYLKRNDLIAIKNGLNRLQNGVPNFSLSLKNILIRTNEDFFQKSILNSTEKNSILNSIENTKVLMDNYEKNMHRLKNDFENYLKSLELNNIKVFDSQEENNNDAMIADNAAKIIISELSPLHYAKSTVTAKDFEQYLDLVYSTTNGNSAIIDDFQTKIDNLNGHILKITDETAERELELEQEAVQKAENELVIEQLRNSLKFQENIRLEIDRRFVILKKVQYDAVQQLQRKLNILTDCYRKYEQHLCVKQQKLLEMNDTYLKIVDKSQNILFFYLMPLLCCIFYWCFLLLKMQFFYP